MTTYALVTGEARDGRLSIVWPLGSGFGQNEFDQFIAILGEEPGAKEIETIAKTDARWILETALRYSVECEATACEGELTLWDGWNRPEQIEVKQVAIDLHTLLQGASGRTQPAGIEVLSDYPRPWMLVPLSSN